MPLDDSYWVGAPGAAVDVVVFSDFQCPFSGRLAKTLAELLERYPNRVRVVFKHMPLPMHRDAHLAHQAALAAGAQGRFWQMHDLLFENQRKLGRTALADYAARLGLDLHRFRGALDSGQYEDRVERDIALAKELGVRGTPTCFIDGHRLSGAQPIDKFVEQVERALAEGP